MRLHTQVLKTKRTRVSNMEQTIENTRGEPRKRMTFAELEQTLKTLDNAGKEANLRHMDAMKLLDDTSEETHLPGMKPGECPICDEVIYSFDRFMKLEKEYFGVSGIPLSEMITQMRLIRSIMKMVEEEKNGNLN